MELSSREGGGWEKCSPKKVSLAFRSSARRLHLSGVSSGRGRQAGGAVALGFEWCPGKAGFWGLEGLGLEVGGKVRACKGSRRESKQTRAR